MCTKTYGSGSGYIQTNKRTNYRQAETTKSLQNAYKHLHFKAVSLTSHLDTLELQTLHLATHVKTRVADADR